jgi:hypothetical protein
MALASLLVALLELVEFGFGRRLRRDIFVSLLAAQVEGREHAVHGVFDCGSHCDDDDDV